MLTDRVAFITGASRGLGRHTALALAEAGMRVALCGRTELDLAEVARDITDVGGTVEYRAVDVRDYDRLRIWVDSVHQMWGQADVLINNAGSSWYKPFVEWTREELDVVFDVNLKGTAYATHAVLPHMIAQGSGHILNVASDLGRRSIPNMAAYISAKHGVVGLSAAILREVKGHGVKVTTLLPGIIDTHFGGKVEGSRDPHWAMKPEHIAQVILQILSQPGNLTLDEVMLHPLGQDY